MSKNQELVNELKNGNITRINFFKDKIIEELKKQEIDYNEDIVNDILNEAINTYTDEVKIPFLFHIKALIKKGKDNNTSNNKDLKVLSLYLNKENGRYLSRIEIANKLNLSIEEVNDIVNKINNDVKYKDKVIKRNNYFDKKSTTLKEKDIAILLDFCGISKKPLTIRNLAYNYDKSIKEIEDNLKNTFRILKIGNNLNNLLQTYPALKDSIYKKSIELNVPLEDLDDKNVITTDFKRKGNLNKDDIIMLNLLDSYNKKEISENLIKEQGFSDVMDFINKRNKFFVKIERTPSFLMKIDILYPNLDIHNLITKTRLTVNEYKVLIFLYKHIDDEVDSELILEESGCTTVKGFERIKKELEGKLTESEELQEMIALISNLDINLLNKAVFREKDIILTDEELLILKILNEGYNIKDDKLIKEYGFKSVNSFYNKKTELLRKIKYNYSLYLRVKKEFPNVRINKNRIQSKLTDKNVELIDLLLESEKTPLTDKEMAKTLNFANIYSYQDAKRSLVKKLRNNEVLKREALSLFPELILDNRIKNLAIKFTKNEIDFLLNFCLLKDNIFTYQSDESIMKNLKLTPEMFKFVRTTSTIKVVKNMIVGNDLDIILWSNFTDEFLIRDNFMDSNSINTENINKENLLIGIRILEESIFKDYVNSCTFLQKAAITLRLGYFNNKFYTSEEISKLINMDEEEIISITKECLQMSKNNFIEEKQKQYIII